MTLNSIDQALNMAITGLIYGSGGWLACAFSAYVVKKQRQKRQSAPLVLPPARASVMAPIVGSQLLDEEITASIEIEIEQPVMKTVVPAEQLDESIIDVEPVDAEPVIDLESIIALESAIATEPAVNAVASPTLVTDLPIAQVSQPPVSIPPVPMQTVSMPPKIVCEPVDWKKWKVADLRKASIAKVCGVRTRPIGSRKNLLKADLIAQYQQQLKRLTKPQPKRTLSEDVA